MAQLWWWRTAPMNKRKHAEGHLWRFDASMFLSYNGDGSHYKQVTSTVNKSPYLGNFRL